MMKKTINLALLRLGETDSQQFETHETLQLQNLKKDSKIVSFIVNKKHT
jgi:hypothetical protein